MSKYVLCLVTTVTAGVESLSSEANSFAASQENHVLCEILMFVTVFTTGCHLTLSGGSLH